MMTAHSPDVRNGASNPGTKLPEPSAPAADGSPVAGRCSSLSAVGRVADVALPAAVFLLVLWNALLVAVAYRFIAPRHDFGKFYYSAVRFLSGADMYGWSPATTTELEGSWNLDGQARFIDLLNMNPPHFHLLFLPLTAFGPDVALLLWLAASAVCLMISLRLLACELRLDWNRRACGVALLLVLASRPTCEVILNGQISFVFLLPVTLLWLAVRREKWVAAGVLLGVLASLKPFFLILLPYFLLERKWRCLAAAAASGAGMFALGAAVFGIENYENWVRSLVQSDQWSWLPSNASLWGALFVRTFTENLQFAAVSQATPQALKPVWLTAAAVLALVTLAVAKWDASPQRRDRALALLLLAAVLLSPLGWVYYYWLPVPPMLALIATWAAEARRLPALPWWRRYWRFVLLGAGVVLLLVPLQVVWLGQPSALATLTLGNIYFWAGLLTWCLLLADGVAHLAWHAGGRAAGGPSAAIYNVGMQRLLTP